MLNTLGKTAAIDSLFREHNNTLVKIKDENFKIKIYEYAYRK